MKRALIGFLAVLMLFTGGCAKEDNNEYSKKELEELNFDNRESINVATEFMQAINNKDIEKIRQLSGKDLREGLITKADEAIKVTGIRLENSVQKGLKAQYEFTVSTGKEGATLATLDRYYLTIKREDGEYKVVSLKAVPKYEVFKENTKLRVRKNDEVEINNVINLKNIPATAYSKNNKGDISKVEIPKNDYGVVGISYGGESIATSVIDESNTFVCIIQVDEAQPTAGEVQEESQEDDEDKDKLLGKKITTLDVYNNISVTSFMFSKDDTYVAVNYNSIDGTKRFKLYESSGDIVELNLENTFQIDKYNILYNDIKNNDLYFKVEKGKDDVDINPDLLGSYKISLDELELTKL